MFYYYNDDKTISSIRLIGDSITSQNFSSSPDTSASTSDASYVAASNRFLTMLMQKRHYPITWDAFLNPVDGKRYGSNSGIGGDSVAGVKARMPAIIASSEEKTWMIHVGTNSINAGVSLATLITDYTDIINMLIDAGITPIMTTVMPRNNIDGGGTGWWSASYDTIANKIQRVIDVNTWMKSYCQARGIKVLDFYSAIVDPATGMAKTGTTSEGLHPNDIGSGIIMDLCDAELTELPNGPEERNPNEIAPYNAVTNPDGDWWNGLFDMSVPGAIYDAGGGGAMPTAAQIPKNMRFYKATATTTDVSITYVDINKNPWVDGVSTGRKWMLITFTVKGTGAALEEWRLEYYGGGLQYINTLIPGDMFRFTMDVKYIAGTDGAFKSIGWYVASQSSIYKQGTTVSFNATTKQIKDSANGFGSFPNNRMVIVGGAVNSANNSRFVNVTKVDAGTLQLQADAVMTTEAAGNNVIVSIPQYRVATNNTASQVRNINTGVRRIVTPVWMNPHGTRCQNRIPIYTNGQITGTAQVMLSVPTMNKVYSLPDVCTVLAHDE